MVDDPEVISLLERVQVRVNRLLEIYADVLQKFNDEETPKLWDNYKLCPIDVPTIHRIKRDIITVVTGYLSVGLIYTQEDMEDLFYIIVSNITINGKNIDV